MFSYFFIIILLIIFFVIILTVLPVIREKLGDAKDSVREKTQVLIQQIMQDTVTSPQVRREGERGKEKERRGEERVEFRIGTD